MAKVLPANSAQAFLDALETSQILSADSIAKIRERFAAADDVKAVARDLIKEGKITKWQAGQLIHNFTALVVGNYKLMDQLGVGEMGRVYLAEHIQMQRKAALKVLARKHTSQPQVLRRLLAEARRVAAIEHPNISHIQDVNQDGERYFIVLEYIDGEDLQKHVQRVGKLPPAKAWNLVRQAAEGIAFAHGKGVVHGGLKPSNLLLDQQGKVKILDFGLAQLASGGDEGSSDSVDQAAITAKLYRAPEAGPGPADRAGDCYSLGATLFYLLTGSPPTDGPASAEKLATESPEINKLCRQLMAGKPGHRPSSDQALLTAIDAAQPNAAPAPAPKASAPPPKAAAPAAKTSTLPTAKALPSASGEMPAAKAPPPKAKKPVVAKALPTDSGSVPAVAETTAVAASETADSTPASDTPFAGFAIQTKGRGKSPPPKPAPVKKSAAETAVAAASVVAETSADDATAETPAPGKAGKKGKGKSAGGNLTLILAGGIGGGVLALSLIIALVIYMMSGGDDKPEIAKNEGDPAAAAPTDPAAGESNPGEANPAAPVESNPVIPAEVNPVLPTVPVEPMAKPMPMEPAPTDPPKTEPAPTEPPKTDPPMVAVATPEVKPEPPPMPKPMPMAIGDPFVGFAKSVALPKIPTGMMEAPPEMLVPVVLGPCRIPNPDAIISVLLKGGETANGKAKVKFSVESANGGTALRDWEIKVTMPPESGKPTTIALMAAKNDQLTFQWVPEAVKQAGAAYLCNCVIELKAGTGKAEFGLRQPISVDPIAIGIEKRTPAATFNVDLPPEPKQLMVEILAVEGDVPKVKYDNKDLLAEKDTTFFWVGNVETEMPMGMKIDTSLTGGKSVKIVLAPQFKLEGMSRPANYGKKELGQLEANIKQELSVGSAMIQQAGVERDAKRKQDLNQQGSLKLEPAQKAQAQFDQLLSLAKGLQSNGKVHFRIYLNAEDAKLELYNSQGAGNGPAPGPNVAPPPVLKAPAGPGGNVGANAPPAARPRPGAPKAAPARAPIGTVEATAEEVGNEALQTDAAAYDEKFKGKQFRITGTVASVTDKNVVLKVAAMKDGQGIQVIMTFAKASDAKGITPGSEVVIDGDFQSRAAMGPTFINCEVVSK